MNTFHGAYFVVTGTSFAAVLVGSQAVSSEKSQSEARAYFRKYFPVVPIVLVTQTAPGKFRFYGEGNLVKYLANSGRQIQWCSYTTE